MTLKSSVKSEGVQGPIWYACGIAEMVYRTNGLEFIVTSLADSHETRPASLHNKGLAVDLRTRHVPHELLQTIRRSISRALRPMGFDVILETDHMHIEFDPKDGKNWQRLDTQIA